MPPPHPPTPTPLSRVRLGLFLNPFILGSGSDRSHSYLALIKIAPAVQVLDTKIQSGPAHSRELSCQVHNTVPSLACLLKTVLILGLFFPFQVDKLFFLPPNLSLPVTAHFNLLCLYHATFATFFWLNIELC